MGYVAEKMAVQLGTVCVLLIAIEIGASPRVYFRTDWDFVWCDDHIEYIGFFYLAPIYGAVRAEGLDHSVQLFHDGNFFSIGYCERPLLS